MTPPKVDKPALLRRFREKADTIEDTIRESGNINELYIYDVLLATYHSPDFKNLLAAKGLSIADTMPAFAPPAPDDDKVSGRSDGVAP